MSDALAAARAGGDARALARALAEHADGLVRAGDYSTALAASDESAQVLESLGEHREATRGALLSSALARLSAQPQTAVERATHALTLLEPSDPLRAPALAELGEGLLMLGQAPQAAAQFGAALEAGVDQAPLVRAGWSRQRALALFAGGDHAGAITAWRAARGLYRDAGDEPGAARAMLEAAAASTRARDAGAPNLRWEARLAVERSGDEALRSDWALLEASAALEAGRAEDALDLAQQARAAALRGTAPSQYLAAAVSISRVFETLGQPVDAYASLASAWVTIKDLLGPDAARAGLEDALLGLQARLGAAAFAAARAEYEAQRAAIKAQAPATP